MKQSIIKEYILRKNIIYYNELFILLNNVLKQLIKNKTNKNFKHEKSIYLHNFAQCRNSRSA